MNCEQLTNQSNALGSNAKSIYATEDDSYVGYAGPEKVYKLVVEEESSYKIKLSNITGGDLDLFLVKSCDSSQVIAYSNQPNVATEQIHQTLTPGAYYLVVDGWNGAKATFDLSIEGCHDPSVTATPFAEMRGHTGSVISVNYSDLAMKEVYPNPFSESVIFSIESNQSRPITLSFFTPEGRLLYRVNHSITSGINRIEVGASSFENYKGLILYHMASGSMVQQGKLIKTQ